MASENIFNTMGYVFNKTYEPTPESIDKIQPYLLNQWLSNNISSVKVAHFLNSANKLPKNIQFDFAYRATPKMYPPKFPKKSQISEVDENDYNILMYKYKCNIDTAKTYKKMLPEDEMQKLRNQFKNFDFE